MTHGSLFSGIGGFDLAAEWMGWENKFHCEWNPFGQKVLKHHFPNADSYHDITKTDFKKYEGQIDIITGGFPCQPYSTAGLRKGKADERHLFPEMLRVIEEVKPRWVIGENVRGLVSWGGELVFEEVHADLEGKGYEVQAFIIPAASVNAPHKRERIWFIAHSNNKGASTGFGQVQSENGEISERNNNAEFSNTSVCNATNSTSIGFCGDSEGKRLFSETFGTRIWMGEKNVTDSHHQRSEEFNFSTKPNKQKFFSGENNAESNCFQNFPTQPPICFRNDGVSSELDGVTFPKWRAESIKAGGNAIVPQVAYEIFKAIDSFEMLQ